ncbi:MAG: MarR family transcriptional regulator [Sphingomicrobium sp.]
MDHQIAATPRSILLGSPALAPCPETRPAVRQPNDSCSPPSFVHGAAGSLQMVRSIIKARALRRQSFAADLFADPAWDMLLELYAIKCEGRRISISKLSMAAGVPGTTALRWIDKLDAEGLVVRTEDPTDARRVWITISPSGLAAMDSYLQQIPLQQSIV